MSGIALVYAVFPDRENAERVARHVIEQGLAACANILAPCTSLYEWEGRLEESNEFPVILKTTAARVDDLIDRIETMHPYEVPAILSWPAVRAPHPFAQWVNDRTHR
ncbi:MAG TPA: divalent-cation tolerance protein CutA [Sphingobium sp.]|nr:divalent-cation tolerance protein CutA [Sphingobium sp.]